MSNRSDNFNRADTTSAIGTPSDAGSAWSQLAGTWGISGNTAYESAGASQATCVLESSSSVVTVQATVSGTLQDAGLIARAADVNNYIMLVFAGGIIHLYKRVAGTFTELTFAAYAYASGDVLTLDIDASNNITCKVNGVTKLTATDAAGSTNTKHGLRTHNTTAVRFDDFSITDNGGGGGGGFKAAWAKGSNVLIGGAVR